MLGAHQIVNTNRLQNTTRQNGVASEHHNHESDFWFCFDCVLNMSWRTGLKYFCRLYIREL